MTVIEEPHVDGDDVAGDIYGLVHYLHASSNRDLLDAIAREQLSFSQLMLLERLRDGAHPTVHQAASMIGISRSGASLVTQSLARRGLVRREEDERDYRSKRLVITDRGLDVIARLHACRLEVITTFAEQLHEDQRAQLQAAIRDSVQADELAQHRPPAIPA